jgi:hypothetical protein
MLAILVLHACSVWEFAALFAQQNERGSLGSERWTRPASIAAIAY